MSESIPALSGPVATARQKAVDYATEHGFDNLPMRSCWNCNGAHEHLRDMDVPFCCFDCGHWFMDGQDITTGNLDD